MQLIEDVKTFGGLHEIQLVGPVFAQAAQEASHAFKTNKVVIITYGLTNALAINQNFGMIAGCAC